MTFSSINTTILPHCTICHDLSRSQGGLGDYTSYDGLKATGYVIAGSPENSKFYLQVLNGAMPKGSPLSAADRQAYSRMIFSWIKDGALNN